MHFSKGHSCCIRIVVPLWGACVYCTLMNFWITLSESNHFSFEILRSFLDYRF